QREAVLHPRLGTSPRVHQVGTTVGVPQWAGIDEATPGQEQMRTAPWARGVRRRQNVDAPVRVGIDDEDRAVVLADRGGPDTTAVAGEGIVLGRGQRR